MMPWAHAKRSPEFRDPQRTRGVSDLDSGTMAHPLQAMLSAASCEGPCLLRETSTSITRACFPKPRDAGTKMRRFPPAATQAHKDVQKPKRAKASRHMPACGLPPSSAKTAACTTSTAAQHPHEILTAEAQHKRHTGFHGEQRLLGAGREATAQRAAPGDDDQRLAGDGAVCYHLSVRLQPASACASERLRLM